MEALALVDLKLEGNHTLHRHMRAHLQTTQEMPTTGYCQT